MNNVARHAALVASAADAGKRIDCFLAEQIADLTRSAAQQLLTEHAVTVNGGVVKKNYKLLGGEQIAVTLPALREMDVLPEAIPLAVMYEDKDIIVINKPRGMVVHPAAGNWSGTLVNALLFHCGDSLSGINGTQRPGIVHRLDKDTSGLLVVAKNDTAHQSLSAQIAAHTAYRDYQAIVVGSPKQDSGLIDKPIARHPTDRKKMAIVATGRSAITHYQVLARYAVGAGTRGTGQGSNGLNSGCYTHMAFRLETGRTHQIRVHMAAIGHPIIGDPVYGLKKDRFAHIGGQCLHAAQLTITHPTTQERLCFSAPLPAYFTEILQQLEKSVPNEEV